jgi:hypothetical protein
MGANWLQSMSALPKVDLTPLAALVAVEQALAETEGMFESVDFPHVHDDLRLAAIEVAFNKKEQAQWSYDDHIQMRKGMELLRSFVQKHMSTDSRTRPWPP